MKNVSTIFTKLFIGLLGASIAVLTVMSVIFVFAIRTSISHWNKDEALAMGNLLLPVIEKRYRLAGNLDASSLEAAVTPYTTDSMFVYIFDENKHPVLLLNRGHRVTLKTVESEVGNVSTFLTLNAPIPIKDGTNVVGYLSVNSRDFLAYKANRQFIATMRTAIAGGVVTAILIALFISLFISSKFSKQTLSLVNEITALGDGKRNITFSHLSTTEFDLIATSEEKLQNQLLKEESLRRQWMLDVSHDLRTPVTAVKVQIEGMGDGVLPATKTRFSNLLSELTHIERLVNNLHDLSRYESPEMKINLTEIQGTEFTDSIREEFSMLADQKQITSSFVCEYDGKFFADEYLLQRCVSNVVQNAIKYTDAGGIIQYALRKQTENIEIEVKNTGALSDENLAHVFDRLYRGDKSRTDGGSGLGLSIARAIMSLHRGTISVANQDGMVCFTMRFPNVASVQHLDNPSEIGNETII